LRKQLEHNWFGKGVRKREGRREGKARQGRRRREKRGEDDDDGKGGGAHHCSKQTDAHPIPLLPFFCLFFSALPALPRLEAAKVHLKI